MLQVNLNTVFVLARDAGRHMLSKQQEGGKAWRGKIINVASLVSFQGEFPNEAPGSFRSLVGGLTSMRFRQAVSRCQPMRLQSTASSVWCVYRLRSALDFPSD